jgi:Holliday junction resolvase-like predicted endonuclease
VTNYTHVNDWDYEGNISRRIVRYLKSKGYQVLKDNSDNCRARGEDIIAVSPEGIKEVIEVKGYPTEFHTKGEKLGQRKPTNPKLQAGHWFQEALGSSINNHSKHVGRGKFVLGLGLPFVERYEQLIRKAQPFFIDNHIELKIYLVPPMGKVTETSFAFFGKE